jgi:AcrR family transcriptional regulator
LPTDPEYLDTRSARKRAAILGAATAVFLQSGYLGTSMDEIAALARVSKQTLYRHFADKESLFVEIVIATVDQISDPVHDDVLALAESGDLEADLRQLARQLLTSVMQPRVLELRRLVIAEASRFPELGRAFYERGPGRTIGALSDLFKRLNQRGELRAPDARLAAAQFNWLVMSAPMNEAMLLGDDAVPGRSALNRHADKAVATFLAAYANA